jgi:MoaA/NifB/PqqE/SkfB family radical SAM enzyme
VATREVVRLGTQCNFACEFCNVLPETEKVGEADFEEAKRRVDEVAGEETILYLSGGEPTLYSYLVKLVKYAKSKCQYVVLQTNALLATKELVVQLKDAGLDGVSINFPSHEPGTFSELTGMSERIFQGVMRGIKNLADSIPASLNLVINEKNYRKLQEYVRFASEEFPGVEVRFSAIQPHGRALKNKHLIMDYRETLPYLEMAVKTAGERGIKIINTNCGMPTCIVSGILPLEQNSEFNIGAEARKSRRSQRSLEKTGRSRVMTPKCHDCYIRNFCMGLWKEYYKLKGDVVEPPHRSLRFWPVQ